MAQRKEVHDQAGTLYLDVWHDNQTPNIEGSQNKHNEYLIYTTSSLIRKTAASYHDSKSCSSPDFQTLHERDAFSLSPVRGCHVHPDHPHCAACPAAQGLLTGIPESQIDQRSLRLADQAAGWVRSLRRQGLLGLYPGSVLVRLMCAACEGGQLCNTKCYKKGRAGHCLAHGQKQVTAGTRA